MEAIKPTLRPRARRHTARTRSAKTRKNNKNKYKKQYNRRNKESDAMLLREFLYRHELLDKKQLLNKENILLVYLLHSGLEIITYQQEVQAVEADH